MTKTGPVDKQRDAHAASLCKLLLEHGADAKAEESAALVLASEHSMSQTCGVLLAAGADVWATVMKRHETQLDIWAGFGKIERMVSSGVMRGVDMQMTRKWLARMRQSMARITSRLDARQDELLPE